MNREKIKELFFSEGEYPFLSAEIYKFFGFGRHNNFVRSIKKDEYDLDITQDFCIVNLRKGLTYSISRNLFYSLCKNYISDYGYITDIYLDYMKFSLKTEILKFVYYKNKQYIFHLDIYETIRGHFYNYSLNTLNIANVLNLDIFELFKFCNIEFYSKYGYGKPEFKKEKFAYPYFTFDSARHTDRFMFIELLKTIRAKYKLTDFQNKLLYIFLDLVNQMINKQMEYDEQAAKRKGTNRKGNNFNNAFYSESLTKDQLFELKQFYRKAAMLCHPDKNNNGEEIFKELNHANESLDLSRVKEIYSKLIDKELLKQSA